jgi:uncharacterized membrane protein
MLYYLLIGVVVTGFMYFKIKNYESYKTMDKPQKLLTFLFLTMTWIIFAIPFFDEVLTEFFSKTKNFIKYKIRKSI